MTVKQEMDPVERAMKHVNLRRFLTVTGITPTLRSALTTYDVEQIAIHVGVMDDLVRWTIGDIAVWIEERTNQERREQGKSYSWMVIERNRRYQGLLNNLNIDINLTTLMNYKATANAFEWGRRRCDGCIKFEHHRLLISRSREEQEYYLDMVESGELSTAQLRAELYGRVLTQGSPPLAWTAPEWLKRYAPGVTVESPRKALIEASDGIVIIESDSEITWRLEQDVPHPRKTGAN